MKTFQICCGLLDKLYLLYTKQWYLLYTILPVPYNYPEISLIFRILSLYNRKFYHATNSVDSLNLIGLDKYHSPQQPTLNYYFIMYLHKVIIHSCSLWHSRSMLALFYEGCGFIFSSGQTFVILQPQNVCVAIMDSHCRVRRSVCLHYRVCSINPIPIEGFSSNLS